VGLEEAADMTYRIVHYINQFYAGIGGEEMADHRPELREGFVGPGMQIEKLFNGEGRVVGTVICGDGYYGENTEEARKACLEMIKGQGARIQHFEVQGRVSDRDEQMVERNR
jgi:betaine reductase